MKPGNFLTCAAALSLLLISAGVSAAAPLPKLGTDKVEVTVSGISSGGYMAVQFQVAYSQMVRGAGILAGGPISVRKG